MIKRIIHHEGITDFNEKDYGKRTEYRDGEVLRICELTEAVKKTFLEKGYYGGKFIK